MPRPVAAVAAGLLGAWMVILCPPAGAEEKITTEAEWAREKNRFEYEYSQPDERRRLAAVAHLGKLDHVEAVRVLIRLIEQPDPRIQALLREQREAEAVYQRAFEQYLKAVRASTNGLISASVANDLERARREIERISERLLTVNQVAVTAEEGLGQTTVANGIAAIVAAADGSRAWQVRAACVRALGRIGGNLVQSTVEGAIHDEVAMVRAAAAEALGMLKSPGSADALLTLLVDPSWQVRAEAIAALRALGGKGAVKPLIDAMAQEPGRLREDIAQALRELTGVDIRGDHQEWLSWWKARGEAWAATPEPPPGAEGEDQGEGGEDGGKSGPTLGEEADDEPGSAGDARTVTFYGIETRSKRILFVIDRSTSMNEPAGYPRGKAPPVPTGEGEAGEVPVPPLPEKPSKLDVAKYELQRAITALEKDALFNVLFYAGEPKLIRASKLMAATPRNKTAMVKAVAALEADPTGTNIHGALDRAFVLAGRDEPGGKLPKDGIDTIFFLSDGKPTRGPVTDTQQILQAARQWNASLKIRIHAVGVGTEHDELFMRRLAEENGGTYVSRK